MGMDLTPRGAVIPAIADDNLLAFAEAAERRVQAINRIKRAALSVTGKNDWTDQGGKPYLQVSGAEKVARLFGMSWRIDTPSCEVDEDGHYSFTFKGYFSMGAAEIEVEGSRSSRDPFFCKRRGETIPPSEVDRNNVRKAALTNCIGSGVTRLLGIRNLTWEDLLEAGINQGNVSSVEYQGQAMSSEAVDQREELRQMILEMSGNDAAKAREMLAQFTEFVGRDGNTVKGKTDLSKLSEKQIPVTRGKVKKAYDEWKKGAGNGASGAAGE